MMSLLWLGVGACGSSLGGRGDVGKEKYGGWEQSEGALVALLDTAAGRADRLMCQTLVNGDRLVSQQHST